MIVLSQLDDRYFCGLEGKWDYKLHFRVQKDGTEPDEYVTRSRLNYELMRSVNVEIDLEANTTYTVLVKVDAHKTSRRNIERVIRKNAHRKQKLTQIGMSYDLAHRKALPLTADGKSCPTDAKPAKQPAENENSTASDDDEDPNLDPYSGACCVIGLRVFSRSADLGVSVKVPPPSDEDQELIISEDCEPIILDGDDPAKAAHDLISESEDIHTGGHGQINHNHGPDQWEEATPAVVDEFQSKREHCCTCGHLPNITDQQETNSDSADPYLHADEKKFPEQASTSSMDTQATFAFGEEASKQSSDDRHIEQFEVDREPEATTMSASSRDDSVQHESVENSPDNSSPAPPTTITFILDYSQS